MEINENQVKKIANLARIHVDEKDIAQYAEDMASILDLISILDNYDLKDIEPMAHPFTNMSQRLRKDVVTEDIVETGQFELFQNIAPATEANLYLVPEVLDET